MLSGGKDYPEKDAETKRNGWGGMSRRERIEKREGPPKAVDKGQKWEIERPAEEYGVAH